MTTDIRHYFQKDYPRSKIKGVRKKGVHKNFKAHN